MAKGDLFAVLNNDGVMIDADVDVDEAYSKATHYVEHAGGDAANIVVDTNVVPMEGKRHNGPVSGKLALEYAHLNPVKMKEILQVAHDKAALNRAREDVGEFFAQVMNDLREAAPSLNRYQLADATKAFEWASKLEFLRQNSKTKKVLQGETMNYEAVGLSLLPHSAAFKAPWDMSSGEYDPRASFCLGSVPECRAACLVNTGNRVDVDGAYAASFCFSQALTNSAAPTTEFMALLYEACLRGLAVKNDGGRRFIRLNVLSDIPWELYVPGFIESAIEEAGVWRGDNDNGGSYYDYTKVDQRTAPKGYDLTLSFSGRNLNECYEWLNRGGRVAVPFVMMSNEAVTSLRASGKYEESHFAGEPGKAIISSVAGAMYPEMSRKAAKELVKKRMDIFPFTFLDLPVSNGDRNDIRPLDDARAPIVGLTYKVARKKIKSTSGGSYSKIPIIDVEDVKSFVVRVRIVDENAPPVVVGFTQSGHRMNLLGEEVEKWQATGDMNDTALGVGTHEL